MYKIANDTLYATIPFDEREKFKSIVKGVKWDGSAKCWAVPATISTFRNLQLYDPKFVPEALPPGDIRDWYERLSKLAKRLTQLQQGLVQPQFPEGFTFEGCQPYKHQEEAIAFSYNLPKAALHLSMGLGKSYCAINVARLRQVTFDLRKVLVVGPVSIRKQWERELNKYSPGTKFFSIEGTLDRKRRVLKELPDEFCFAYVSYESVFNILQELDRATFDMFILDESSKIKSPRARRTRSVVELCSGIPYGLELTGAAYLGNPVDLFSQFLALDTSVYGASLYSFEDKYITFRKMPFGRIPVGVKDLKDLKERAYFIAYSKQKKDCLDLPEKIYVTRNVELNIEQSLWYKNIVEKVVNNNNNDIRCSMKVQGILSEIEKLRQLSSGFLYLDDGSTEFIGSPKYQEVLDVVEESNAKFLIWCVHRFPIRYLLGILAKEGISAKELSSHVSEAVREETIKDFKTGSLRVLVLSLQSECRGLDLTSNTEVNSIYFESSYNYDERVQSENRQHRIGMTGSATYVDIVTEDTIEEGILKVLGHKGSISEYIADYGVQDFIGSGAKVKSEGGKRKKPILPEELEELEALRKVKIKGFIS